MKFISAQSLPPLFDEQPVDDNGLHSCSAPDPQQGGSHSGRFTVFLPALLLGGALAVASGCAGDGTNKQTVGAVTGAIIGAAIGNQIGSGSGRTIATGAGLVLGALAGSEIGRRLDEQDRIAQAEATAEVLNQDGQAEADWDNPESGVAGSVEAGPVEAGGQANLQCRTVKQKVILQDGTAMDEELQFCRRPDGPWELTV